MFKMAKTPAFVLKKFNFRETDRIYTVYTKELGKISILARSARKIKSKLSGGLENFDEVQINFIQGRIFNHFAGSSVLRRNNFILKDSDKIVFMQSILNLIDRFVKPDECDENIFNLLQEVSVNINNNSVEYFPKIDVYFFWRLIDFLGYRPQLDGCALCGKMISDREFLFNVTDHIIICKKCAGEGIFMQEGTLERLRSVFKMSLEDFIHLDIDKELLNITDKSKQIKLSEL